MHHLLQTVDSNYLIKLPLEYSSNIINANQTYLYPPSTLHFEVKDHLSTILIEMSYFHNISNIFKQRKS